MPIIMQCTANIGKKAQSKYVVKTLIASAVAGCTQFEQIKPHLVGSVIASFNFNRGSI